MPSSVTACTSRVENIPTQKFGDLEQRRSGLVEPIEDAVMGLTHSPRIVTDGLVFCVDAADARSYPGTGLRGLTDL